MALRARDVWSVICAGVLSSIAAVLFQQVQAYDSRVEADLRYSRNALLRQRSELEAACDRKAAQVADLERDIDRLQAYLKDTDHALRNIDTALRGN